MARREVTQFFDDLTGEELSKDELVSVELGYAGKSYVLDLSHESALELATDLDPWLSHARKVTASRKSAPKSDAALNRVVREWAAEQGIEVSARGRISADVMRRYDEAHSK